MKPITKSILLMSITPLLMLSCGLKQEKQPEKNFQVKVCKVELADNPGKQDFSFISKPYRSSQLSFRIGGPINKFEVYSGNHYKQGDIISQIDPRDFEIRKNKAEAIYNQAKAEFERIEVLYQKNNISASTFEKAKAEYTSSKMAFQTASNELSDTKLVSPFNGYVGEVYIEQYQDVKATQPVVSLVDISRLKIEAYVPQNIAFNAKKGDKISLYFDAMPDKEYSATIEEISKSTTQNNLSYLLTAILPNPEANLLAGMSGKIYFNMPSQLTQQAVTIPQIALCNRPTVGNYVWVVNKDKSCVNLRKVKVGELQQSGIIIKEGLVAGELLATSGLGFLSENATVAIAQ